MAPRNQNRHLDSSSVAPVAVAKRAPRRKGSRHAGSSRMQSKASEEEFDLQEIEDGAETSDTSGPPNPSPELERQTTRPPQADTLNVPVRSKKGLALDLIYFFDGFNPTPGRRPSKSKGESPGRICKLCSEKYGTDESKVPRDVPNFFYQPNTANGNLRRHLLNVHPGEYDDAVKKNNWNYRLSTHSGASTHNAGETHNRGVPSFSSDVFLEYLVRFIVVDDQSIRVVECPEFRQLCMLLRETLVDTDIPRRDKMREAIIVQWRNSFEELKSRLSKSCGRVSFTADVWSNVSLEAYLALTAHWISCDESNGRLALNAALIGFHRLKKKHTGVNIAKNILHLIDRAGLTLKIGHFTLDNAENNATAMQELQSLLAKRETSVMVDFDHLQHRVRCYAHIINICCSHIISSVTSVSKQYLAELNVPIDSNRMFCEGDVDDSDDDHDSDDGDVDRVDEVAELELDRAFDADDPELQRWFTGIKRNPIKRARKMIRFLRASDLRRQGLRAFIKTGNEQGWFFQKTDDGKSTVVKIEDLQLLRDVKTRWDSVYLMLERLKKLRPAIDRYFDFKLAEHSHLKLSELDWDVLEGLQCVLRIPHSCQQSMSSESTPVLSRAISSFEVFMTDWEKLGEQYAELRPWTNIGLKWAKKYYIRMDDTDAYIITMFLNPTMRFSWINNEWDKEYITYARETILRIMHRYRGQKSSTSEATTTPVPTTPVPAPVSRFKFTDSAYKKKTLPSDSSVKTEFERYASGSSSDEANILGFWEANRTEFPTLFSIAMDYLPVQATSVPCERVFSSAKDTDTAKRNRISPVLMEALQMFKHALRKERLDFMAGWQTLEAAMGESKPVPARGLNSLLGDNRDNALDNLLTSFLSSESR